MRPQMRRCSLSVREKLSAVDLLDERSVLVPFRIAKAQWVQEVKQLRESDRIQLKSGPDRRGMDVEVRSAEL